MRDLTAVRRVIAAPLDRLAAMLGAGAILSVVAGCALVARAL